MIHQMNITLRQLLTILILASSLMVAVSGCLQQAASVTNLPTPTPESTMTTDQPAILPNWTDGNYHDYPKLVTTLTDYDTAYPGLVTLDTIGKSVDDRYIWSLKITNESHPGTKYICLFTGCIHGNEWEGGEACLYLAEYLLINYARNQTITKILDTTEIDFIPLINPDGRQLDQRWNDNGIDLNRNFPINFAAIRGRCLPIGKILGFIKIPHIGGFTNCGRRSFSEPETQAIRDFMNSLNDTHMFSVYVDLHTAQHMMIHPWTVPRPPFKVSTQQQKVFDAVDTWVIENTEYLVFNRTDVFTSGDVLNWCFKTYHIPSFAFELLSKDYEPLFGHGRHDQLVHWMGTALPTLLFFVVNAENFHTWSPPTLSPP